MGRLDQEAGAFHFFSHSSKEWSNAMQVILYTVTFLIA